MVGRRIDRPWGGRGQPVSEVLTCCPTAGSLQPCPSATSPGARSFYVDTLGLTPVVEGEDVLAFRCADGTDFGVFVSQGRPSGTHTQMTFFCQNLDAEMADLRAHGVKLEEFDMPGATIKDGVYDRNGQRRLVPGSRRQLVGRGGAPGRFPLLIASPSTPIRST
jgi:hypothetical protein